MKKNEFNFGNISGKGTRFSPEAEAETPVSGGVTAQQEERVEAKAPKEEKEFDYNDCASAEELIEHQQRQMQEMQRQMQEMQMKMQQMPQQMAQQQPMQQTYQPTYQPTVMQSYTPETMQEDTTEKVAGSAIWSFVLSLIALFMGTVGISMFPLTFISLPAAILAFLIGCFSRNRAKRKKDGLAVAGMIIGLLVTIGWIGVVIFCVFVFGIIASLA